MPLFRCGGLRWGGRRSDFETFVLLHPGGADRVAAIAHWIRESLVLPFPSFERTRRLRLVNQWFLRHPSDAFQLARQQPRIARTWKDWLQAQAIYGK